MSKLARMRFKNQLIALSLGTLGLASCGEDKSVPKETDTPTSGVLKMVVDETYKPVIEEEVKVFMSNYPDAKIEVSYKPEAEAIQDYLAGKTKLIVVSRKLTEKEEQYCLNNKNVPSSLELAKDAVALVCNKDAKDTAFSILELKGIIAGESQKKYTIVFDNAGSSTLRFITDSVMGGQKTGKNLYAVKGNQQVIDYVKKNPEALGFVGLSFVTDTMDSTAERFSTSIKVASVYSDTMQEYYQPYQADIALKHYPLVRKMTYIKNETYQGLATGFSNFMASDIGQMIMGKERLVPLRMSIVVREAEINTKK
ncbi:MAG: substrate-binding domain-containing protein [Chitinophagaceae bacterium]